MGGLAVYQEASLYNEKHQICSAVHRWVMNTLRELHGNAGPTCDGHRPLIRLLDVGALSGFWKTQQSWIDATLIDLNPRDPAVDQQDFLTFPIPPVCVRIPLVPLLPPLAALMRPYNRVLRVSVQPDRLFDAVVLSLVVNTVPDPRVRGSCVIIRRITDCHSGDE